MPRRLDKLTTVLYGVGAVAFGVKDGGFSFFLLLYYNQVLGLPETWVGLGIMLTLILDGVIDPMIGYVSDHLHSPWGRRHPLMYAAALPAAASFWLLWNPPNGLSPEALFVFFVVVSVFVRVSIAVYEIPNASLVPELTDQYDERTSILSYRFFFGWWGGLTLSVLAYAVFLQPSAEYPIGQLNPEGYQRYGLVAALVMLAAILVSSVGTHAYIPRLRQPSPRRHTAPMGAFRELKDTLTNRSFLAVFCAGIFGSMAAGLNAALGIYFNTYFWELTSTEISILVVAAFPAALLAGGLAPAMSRRSGKKTAAIRTAVAAVVLGPLPIALRLVGLVPPNRSAALFWLLLVFTLATVTLIIMSSILTASMVADIVEDSEVVTGRRSEGVFVAANEFVQKATSGVGIFASTLLLVAIGFPRGAKPGEVDPEIVRTLGLVYAPVIVTLYLLAIGFLATYKISRETHEQNLERLSSTRDASRGRAAE